MNLQRQMLGAFVLSCAVSVLVCCNKAQGVPAQPAPKTQTPAAPTSGAIRNKRKLPLHQIKLPPGFAIEMYAEDVPKARELSLAPSGTLFIGSNAAGKVYAASDSNKDLYADEIITLASGLHLPVGVAFHNGDLYYSQVEGVWRIPGVEQNLRKPAASVRIATFPSEEHHGWKFIAFGPDKLLYVPVGVPCNVCDEGDPFGAILRMKPDGSDQHVIARGMRNTVGFDWHPTTGELWWTDNGRDMMGDNIPPDELNRIPKGSGIDASAPHFGFPYWHGGIHKDPEFGSKGLGKDKYIAPVQNLGPHVAALGMEFYTGTQFPAEYRNQIFIAEHGSWNRSSKIGYRIMLVKTDGVKSSGYSVFAEGWKDGEDVWGRPADVEVTPDGSLLVSDDFAGCVYRIWYKGR
ncbi:MAG: PQQ-dependent sugar dehydrogenase [bacterium]|nr:PQQ-dependent sugar dehydrogenase [bacterium]